MGRVHQLEVRGHVTPELARVLTDDALRFVDELEERFGERRRELLGLRRERQARLDAGQRPDFLPETVKVREGDWRAAPLPPALLERRVEITGPVDRKMVINALNSGADVYMADLEDSHSPTWVATLQGQVNLSDAVRRSITLDANGKHYRLNDRTATLLVRPRGWHLEESHVHRRDRPISASLFDFGLYFFHNAKELILRGAGPYFYLPKLESHLEARLWNDVFVFAQQSLDIPRGTIKATVLIETILAAFEMDEILFELRDHVAGLNCGRWDYIFSFIKKFRNDPAFVLPDRATVTMDQHFLKSYGELLVKTCHRRGVLGMGGMAPQIPIKEDAEKNRLAIAKVTADKEREVKIGHDGTWVAHPGLVAVAREVYGKLPGPNQLNVRREDVHVTAADLLTVPQGAITDAGLRTNVSVALQYLEAWLGGNGCVPINHLMEDAATAEISRAQIWQWIRYGYVTADHFRAVVDEEYRKLARSTPQLREARDIFERLCTQDQFEEFLTSAAYGALVGGGTR